MPGRRLAIAMGLPFVYAGGQNIIKPNVMVLRGSMSSHIIMYITFKVGLTLASGSQTWNTTCLCRWTIFSSRR
jgi:hypothetical protein